MPKKTEIIIADDDPLICQTIIEILTEKGYTASCAKNGYELLIKLKEKTADIVILDLIMPQKSGIEIISTIKSLYPKTKIIVYTGFKQYEDSTYTRKADKFHLKGNGPKELLISISELTAKLPH